MLQVKTLAIQEVVLESDSSSVTVVNENDS